MPESTIKPVAPRRTGDAIVISGDYQHKARHEGFVVQRFWHAEKERIIRRFSLPHPGDRVLDVGCGSGVIASLLAQCGAHATGVDANPQAIEYASKTFRHATLDFRLGSVEELDFTPDSIDRIYCLELIEHLYENQVSDLLRAMHHLVKPGGTVMLTTPNYRGLWPMIELTMDILKLAPQMDEEQHVTRFHHARLRQMLEATGWRVERLTTFSTFAPFVSVINWKLAEQCAALEDRLSFPFGNLILAVATKP